MSLNNYVQVPASIFDASASETHFWIDIKYVTDVNVAYAWGKYTTLSSVDHPAFSSLRYMLGFLRLQESWSNGDRVTREFYLNNVLFAVGAKFCCAAAIKWDLQRHEQTFRVTRK